MNDHEFWALVSLVRRDPPATDQAAFAPLEAELGRRGEAEIKQFEDILAQRLYDLDRSELAAVPSAATGLPLSSDSFLYYRGAVVLAGEQAYRSVLEDPEKFRSYTGVGGPEAEFLLYVAQHAYESSTGKEWEHVSPVDYETGSNPAGWS
ncbi:MULTISPECIES: DUF4240 domain-containing protein [Amycolatopsis]|uniref:DUF4240 domain-containing protein n=1 Tax=Amycolatopsis dendrobii TaxID=2760662 RepID=A0A7W3W2M4_9PSEU|nr:MULTISPECIES: DUF4240 domain-containing protein [Amycolatopsis]MBB1157207.1 DUF4240 domain-containing protein [Amycolatopsis dendrobii]UKD59405.1 DUF4240 domain-containing protein [Amycolatopsis sp. FU40]